MMLGQLYLSERRLDAARDEFGRLAERASNAAPETMVGMIFVAQGRTTEARQAYERTLAKCPHAGVAANNLACLLADAGQLDRALHASRGRRTTSCRTFRGERYARLDLLSPQPAARRRRNAVAKHRREPRDSVYRITGRLRTSSWGWAKAAREDLTLALANRRRFPAGTMRSRRRGSSVRRRCVNGASSGA